MELAKRKISNNKTVKNKTLQDIKDFSAQLIGRQVKKAEHIVFMMPATKIVSFTGE